MRSAIGAARTNNPDDPVHDMDSARESSKAAPQPARYASCYVEAGSLHLHYLDYGTAGRPPMLCVHGGAAHAHWYDFVAAGFTAGYHVRAIDLRGHGDSPWADPPDYSYERHAADLDAAVRKLDLRDFVLVGHSMGGSVSMAYASTYPGRLARLVIVDTTMELTPDRINSMRQVGNREGSSFETEEEFVARFKLRPGGTSAAAEVTRHLARHSGRQVENGRYRHKFDRNVYATRESFDGLPCWDRIRIPSLLVKGERSPRISPEVFAAVKARCPQAEFAEVPGSDHHVTLDNPAGFVEAVNAFLRRHA
jgi:pimeloyl-ACP methyl ester carboxylesterase